MANQVKKTPVKRPDAAKASAPQTRRPPGGRSMPQQYIEELDGQFNTIKAGLGIYAAHLRALDRKRLNDVGTKRQGFIERACEYAAVNSEFLPHYLTLEKFTEDNDYFTSFRSLFDSCKQIQEILWNITVQSADAVYTDALEFYASVREAAKRRVDTAETIHKDLEIFFKHKKTGEEAQTVKKTMRDAGALLRGAKNGRVLIENVKPKLTGGKRKVIDEKFTDTASFKETEESGLEE